MKMVTPKQIAKTINLIVESGIESEQYQTLLESGRFNALLRDFVGEETHPEPTITVIRVPLDYSRKLVAMRNATHCDGYISPDLKDKNFPVEAGESGERELVLVCFHRFMADNEDPTKSELLRELDALGLKPEGPAELCAIGEHHPELQREFPIVARRHIWRSPYGGLRCPFLLRRGHKRNLSLFRVQRGWGPRCRFLASRK